MLTCPRCGAPIPGPYIGPCVTCRNALAEWVEEVRVHSATLRAAARAAREQDAAEALEQDERERERRRLLRGQNR